MSGRHKFSELEANMSAARRARIDRLAQKLSDELAHRPSPTASLPDAVLELLRDHPGGLTRQQIRQKLGLKASESVEQSISEALGSLTDANRVAAREQKYVAA